MTVQRFDAGVLRSVERTPQGGIRAPANLTRTGVFTYSDADGKSWKEYRSPEEVFRPDSLATLAGAPVTDMHPDAPVTSKSWRKHAVGHLGEQVTHDDAFVQASVYVQDADIIKRIESGERREVSCGYTCDVARTPGEHNGERYDCAQTNIVYNHVAIGPVGWGRAGSDVRLRLDGAAVQVTAAMDSPAAFQTPPTTEKKTMGKILKVGGREYRSDDDTQMAEAQTAVDKIQSDYDKLSSQCDAMDGALKDAMVNCAGMRATIATLEAKENAEPNEGEQAAALDAKIAVREKLRSDARKVIGEAVDLSGKTTRQIHETVVGSVLTETKFDGLPSEKLAGMFEALVKTTPTKPARNDALGFVNALASKPVEHADSLDPQEARRKELADRWKQPLSSLKGA